jgi:LuxR family transcriptional regulator, quorum-sensing system regulator BjaR1
MALKGDPYGKRTLDFVERLQKLTDYEAICREIKKELEWFGLTCVTAWSMPGPGRPHDEGILFNNRPRDYIEHYKDRKYLERDALITEMRRSLHPYTWNDVRQRRKLNKLENHIIDEGREFGVNDGLIIPIVTLSGSLSVFSPCGLDPDLSQRARSALEIIGIYSQQALKRALIHTQREEAAHTPLTPREREIMQWVAIGKSDEEIAALLSIGAATVTTHVESAKRKLDAFRRTYAVVQAIRFGEINI